MKSHFKKIPEESRKAKFIHVRVSAADAEIIAAFAAERNLNVCEFMRRAALGRRADVRFETEIVLQLKGIVQTIRT
ncbi:MAG: plasmid mobilization protein, partial [Burkholderiales bacterium]